MAVFRSTPIPLAASRTAMMIDPLLEPFSKLIMYRSSLVSFPVSRSSTAGKIQAYRRIWGSLCVRPFFLE
jgi:hypothetical protein